MMGEGFDEEQFEGREEIDPALDYADSEQE
jgi:hypothetical protein